MFRIHDTIDGKFRVDGVCSESGGMGVILHVSPIEKFFQNRIVLKYCRDSDEEQLRRFRREVRLMASFEGNSKVAQIVDHNLDHEPPYYVMKYYADGDVSRLTPILQSSLDQQERCFLQMIDCVQELHSRNEYHRDIKPANFLLDGQQIVVSDFGLTTEIGSNTAFTRSSVYWGTHGFIPPEFLNGGFKHADAPADIFMLGKTFYALLTGRDPMYLERQGVPAPLFHIIDRCCGLSRDTRYKTLADLKQSLVAAYDVLLQRSGGLGKVKQLLTSIREKLETGGNYEMGEVLEFIEQLALLDEREQVRVCFELSPAFFLVVGQQPSINSLPTFLQIYEKLVESRDYGWSYAETIASNMRRIFDSEAAMHNERARALELAIRAAEYMNRYAAMDTCRAIITAIHDEVLGLQVAPVLLAHRNAFISGIEPSECRSNAVAAAIRQLRQQQDGGQPDPAAPLPL